MADDQGVASAQAAGYTDAEINKYLGIEHGVAPESTRVENPWEGFVSGIEGSSGGFITRSMFGDNSMPKMLPQDADRATRIAHMAGVAVGDIPAMVAGGIAGGTVSGGNPIVAGAGMFALPEAIKSEYIDALTKGQVKGPGDFAERQAAVLWNTVKAGVVGGVMGPAGKYAGAGLDALGAGTVTNFLGQRSAELTAMTTVSKALEGQLPTVEDFTDGAIMLAAFHGAGKLVDGAIGTIKENLGRNWAATGESPVEAARRAAVDPVFRAQLQAPRHADADLPDDQVSATDTSSGPFKIARISDLSMERDAELNNERVAGSPSRSFSSIAADQAKATQLTVEYRGPIDEVPRDRLNRNGGALPPPPPIDTEGTIGEQGKLPPPKADPWEVVGSRIADRDQGPGWWQQIKDTGHKLYLELFRPDDPLNKLQAAVEKGLPLDSADNPAFLRRLAENSNSRSQYMVERKMIDTQGNVVGRGLNEILEPFKGAEEKRFWTYGVARWAAEKAMQGKETGVDLQAAHDVIAEGNDTYRDAFHDLMKWQNGTLLYLHDAGMMSREAFEKMMVENRSRLPGYREAEEGSPESASKGGVGKTAFNPVKKFEGSDLQVKDILSSLLKDAFVRVEVANRNIANRALADAGQHIGLAVKLSEKEAPPMPTGAELSRVGIDGEDPSLVGMKLGWTTDADKVPIFRDGQRELWKFHDPEVTSYLKGFDNQTMSTWQKMVSGVTKVTRGLIVMNPLFPVKLMTYDVPWQFITKPGFRNTLADTIVGLRHVLGDTEQYDAWLKSGGAERVFQGLTKNDYIKDLLKGRGDPSFGDGVWNVISSPYHALRSWGQTLNEAQRVGNFTRNMQAGDDALRAGASSTEAAFHRASFGGPAAKIINAVQPFTAAYLNSLEQTFRGMAGFNNFIGGKNVGGNKWSPQDMAEFSAKAAAVITIPMIANWYVNKDEEWYKAAPDWQKDNGIFIPVGGGHHFWFKFPPVLSLIYGTIPRRLAEAFTGDVHSFDGLAKSIGASFLPPGGLISYNAFLPLVEHIANHSFFRDQPLVSDDLRNSVLTPEQSNPYTSQFATAMGRLVNDLPLARNFGLSPPVIDNYIQGWGGTLAPAMTKAYDLAFPRQGAPAFNLEQMPLLSSFLERYPSANAQPIRDFMSRMDTVKQTHGSLMATMAANDPTRFKEVLGDNPNAAALSRFQMRGVNAVRATGTEGRYQAQLEQASHGANIADVNRVLMTDKALTAMRQYAKLVGSPETPAVRQAMDEIAQQFSLSRFDVHTALTPNDKRQMLDQTYGWMQSAAELGLTAMDRLKLK